MLHNPLFNTILWLVMIVVGNMRFSFEFRVMPVNAKRSHQSVQFCDIVAQIVSLLLGMACGLEVCTAIIIFHFHPWVILEGGLDEVMQLLTEEGIAWVLVNDFLLASLQLGCTSIQLGRTAISFSPSAITPTLTEHPAAAIRLESVLDTIS